MPTVATPTFSPVAGSYGSTQSVTISSATGGATLLYTTDGSTPTETDGIVTAFHASAGGTGYAVGDTGTITGGSGTGATYRVTQTDGGLNTNSPGIVTGLAIGSGGLHYVLPGNSLTTATGGSQPGTGTSLLITLDSVSALVPTGSTVIYSTPVSISATSTIKAIGYLAGDTNSAVATALYHIIHISALSPAAHTIEVIAETFALSGGVVTGGATNVTTWTSSNTAVATVNSSGLVTAVAAGATVITAKAADLTSVLTTSTITVALISKVDITYMQGFLSGLVLGAVNGYGATQQTAALTALANLRTGSLTTADLILLQSILSDQVQTLGTNSFQKAEQVIAAQALADIRSLL